MATAPVNTSPTGTAPSEATFNFHGFTRAFYRRVGQGAALQQAADSMGRGDRRTGASTTPKCIEAGQPNLQMEDFVDMEAAMDPGHFEPNAKLAAMDRDGVEAEVIFPEVSGGNLCTPKLMSG